MPRGLGRLIQLVKALNSQTEDLSPIPKTHVRKWFRGHVDGSMDKNALPPSLEPVWWKERTHF